MEAALKAIAEPRRARILTLIKDSERSAGEIAAHFEISGPAISQHLKVLKEAGLVKERRDGTRRLYVVRPEGLADIRSFVEQFWMQRLGRLKQAAETEERIKKAKARKE